MARMPDTPEPPMGPVARGTYCRAFSTLGCPDLDLEGVVKLARAHEIGVVELRALGGTIDLPAYFSMLNESAERLSLKADESGVRIVSLSTSLRVMDGSDRDWEEFLRFIPLAEAMRVPWLRVFDGGLDCSRSEVGRASAWVARWRELRATRGWKADIMVETHDALSTSRAIGRLVAAVPGVRILWDTHHTWRVGGEAPSDTWRAIGPSVAHLHVKDSRREAGPGGRSSYRLPGTGDYPMAELREAIGKSFTGAVSLEWEKMWHPELPSLDEALRSARSISWW